MVTRRRWLGAAAGVPSLAALGGLAAPRAARAADPFPARPIRLIVPFAAGGGTDVLARILANDLGARLGQPMVVENRAGAGGNLAMEAVIRAPADGYTLLMGTNGAVAVNRHLYRGLPFDPVRDLAAVSLTFRIEHLLVVRPDLPARSVAELIALARARPGQMTFGSAGSGSMIHLAGELFRLRAGVDLTHVPYRGGGPAMNDLVAGTIDMMFDSLPSAEPQVRAGRVRALALCAPRRHALMPELPTMVEAGVPDYAARTWGGVFAPVGTPQPVVERLGRAIQEAAAAPGFRAQMARSAGDVEASSPEELARMVREESATWGQVVREANITPS